MIQKLDFHEEKEYYEVNGFVLTSHSISGQLEKYSREGMENV